MGRATAGRTAVGRNQLHSRKRREPLWCQSVTDVSGINSYPCVRNGPGIHGTPGGIRTPDPQVRSPSQTPEETVRYNWGPAYGGIRRQGAALGTAPTALYGPSIVQSMSAEIDGHTDFPRLRFLPRTAHAACTVARAIKPAGLRGMPTDRAGGEALKSPRIGDNFLVVMRNLSYCLLPAHPRTPLRSPIPDGIRRGGGGGSSQSGRTGNLRSWRA